MKNLNLFALLFSILIFFGCATKSGDISSGKQGKSMSKYSLTLPFSTDNLNGVKFYPIKDVLRSINYSYNINATLDNGTAAILPKYKDSNILLVKFYNDNLTILLLLGLRDSGAPEQVVPIYTTVNDINKIRSSFKIKSINMTTKIDTDYNVVIKTKMVLDDDKEETDTLLYSIDSNGIFTVNNDNSTIK